MLALKKLFLMQQYIGFRSDPDGVSSLNAIPLDGCLLLSGQH